MQAGGCQGGKQFWYGYKEPVSVDMQSGLINKVAATSAEVTDAQELSQVCPSGVVFGDKGYCVHPAQSIPLTDKPGIYSQPAEGQKVNSGQDISGYVWRGGPDRSYIAYGQDGRIKLTIGTHR